MDTEVPKSTPEEVPQSEKRKERKERKERKKLEHEAKRKNPPPQPDNSSFLARPWIKLLELDETIIQHRVRVMTWNVCPIVPQTHTV